MSRIAWFGFGALVGAVGALALGLACLWAGGEELRDLE